jgi:pimeloyl-ACP methyl ester carboxylesterase
MNIVDVGSGPPVVVIPGIQGRWEWMRPGIDALARRCRVITFSLADERTCGGRFDARTGFANYVEQVADAMDQAGLQGAAVCGVSYGGLIAASFAARHPDRVSALLLVSALPPSWRPDRRVRFYLRAPRLLSPLFYIASLRLYREFASAYPAPGAAMRAALRHAWAALSHPMSPARMARRVELLAREDLGGTMRDVRAPALIVTGEPALDRVVPVRLTSEYLSIWPHARSATIERTGHLGIVTRPEEFARVAAPFVAAAATAADSRRLVG